MDIKQKTKKILLDFIVEQNFIVETTEILGKLIDIDFFQDYDFVGSDVWWSVRFLRQSRQLIDDQRVSKFFKDHS